MAVDTRRAESGPRGPVSASLNLYRSGVGKKIVMALTGLMLLAWLLAHTVGSLKMYLGPEPTDHYSEWLRSGLLTPILPAHVALWAIRVGLLVATALHLHAAWALVRMNRRARPDGYASGRRYTAAGFAARTIKWTGVIVALFVVYHLMDLTWGGANPGGRWDSGPYGNTVQSFQRWPVAAVYVVATAALTVHLFHGVASLLRTLGAAGPRWDRVGKAMAYGVSGFVGAANASIPVAVLAGWVR